MGALGGSLFLEFFVKMLILLIFSVVLFECTQGQLLESLRCVDDSDALHSTYHAPARVVPLPRVDPLIRRGFLELFHRETNPTHSHNDPHDAFTAERCLPPVIDAAIIAQINQLCPRDAFFYSFAPGHMMATMLLQQQLMNMTTPAEVLRVSRVLLNRHSVNPRVWYYALLSTIFMRQDLNGYYLAWAEDATPDLYLSNSVLEMATRGSTRPPPMTSARQCRTAIGVEVTAIRHELPGGTAVQQQQQQMQNNCAGNDSMGQGQAPNGFPNPRFALPNSRFPNQQLPSNRILNQQFALPNSRIPNQQFPNQQPQNGQGNFITFYPNEIKQASEVHFGYRKKRSSEKRSSEADETTDKVKRERRQTGQCILYNGTRGATGAENRLWYFREDVMVNHHHWYWHQYFNQPQDRRGEQFYFTHHNLIARYNAERLSNGLSLELPLDLRLGGNIGEGYNSDLADSASGRFWSPRVASTPLNDINHLQDRDFQLNATMADITRLFNNLTSHIAQGFLVANRSNNIFPLNIRTLEGLSHLGNTIEAVEDLSTHAQFYHPFGVHNLGHIAVALATDPDFRCQLPTGVMADLTVTMRDPAFYKVHSLVDVMFYQYKSTLPLYQLNDGEWPLQWEGVRVRSLEVMSRNQINYLRTFWSLKRFPLEEGIDGSIHDGDVNAEICHQHLNHDPFTFRMIIDVNSCARTVSRRGTVRLFMAPRFDVNGRRFTMDETRRLMFQLDSFPIDLRRGRNTITRNSLDSASTRPWSRSLQEMLRDPNNGNQTEYCGCGWPNHLYIPKGSPQGMQFDVFAMVTNFDQDQVLDTNADLGIQEPCHSPHILCGIPYRRYPDARPMGYPFDMEPYLVVDRNTRLVRAVKDLEEYVSGVGNSMSSVVIVQHFDTVLGQNLRGGY